MLYINNQRVIENIVVYGDDRQFNVFYPVPEKPTFMVDEKGYPVFKFIKYRFPIDRADGKKGGGFVVFATEFTIPDEKMAEMDCVEYWLQTGRLLGPGPKASKNVLNGSFRLM